MASRWRVFSPLAFAAALPVLAAFRASGSTGAADIDGFAPVEGVAAQPFVAATRRVAEALALAGSPLGAEESESLRRACELPGDEPVAAIQRVLAPRVLFAVHVNPECRVKVARGPAVAELVEGGSRAFLVRVENRAGITAPLTVASPNALLPYAESTGAAEPAAKISDADVRDRFLDVSLHSAPPLAPALSGLELEYRIVEILSRDAGKREGLFAFSVGQGTQDLGFRSEASVLFECVPSAPLVFDVVDDDGKTPVMASFVIRDARGRVYPAPSRRLAPDLFFQPQVYRASGETVSLPPGRYEIEFGRGPEYLREKRTIEIAPGEASRHEPFRLRRWIDPAAHGYWSGDHHVHAGGCAHYEAPTAGVTPEVMMRHVLGEALNVGCVLSWGPCWYVQKGFFEGRVHALSTERHLLRYDVEVSGFPSDHAGHLSLLRLKEDDYPGTTRIEEWPSYDLPILRWAKEQGAVTGFSHSGFGLAVDTDRLPNTLMPEFDGIGANEFIVDVAHGVVDFISTVDTPHVWELNIWYHTLNCGFRARISGETDFPCIYGERVGMGRVYCRLDGPLDFDRFCDALRDGRSYVSDGKSHLIDFAVNGVAAGGDLALAGPGRVAVAARVAARLDETPDLALRDRPYTERPFWDLERARIGDTRRVPVELIVNGEAVDRVEIAADGALRDVAFEAAIEKSSWIALRIRPSSHTNPVFVTVAGKPVRASAASAEWCLRAVDQCWKSKSPRIRESERAAARAAYDLARDAYRRILEETR